MFADVFKSDRSVSNKKSAKSLKIKRKPRLHRNNIFSVLIFFFQFDEDEERTSGKYFSSFKSLSLITLSSNFQVQ